jgi:hypothetical protein
MPRDVRLPRTVVTGSCCSREHSSVRGILIKISNREAAESNPTLLLRFRRVAMRNCSVSRGYFYSRDWLLFNSEAPETEAAWALGRVAMLVVLGRRCDHPVAFQHLPLAVPHHDAYVSRA